MSKWEKVKLGEIGVIITGNTPKTSDKENYSSKDISFYKPSDIAENNVSYLNISEAYVSEVARSKVRILPKGSILVTCIGIIGKIGILEHEATCNQQINAIIPDQDICLNRYIAYSIFFNRDRLRDIANAPVVPIVNKTQFSNMIIPIPPLEEQRRIADILDKASNLIDLRKQQLKKMDLLIKSKFIDMFGNPVTNPKGWEGKKIEDIAEVKIGPFGSLLHLEDYVENGHPLINPSHILNESITYDSKKTITDEKYKEMKPYHLQINDIVLGRRGEIGRCAIVKQNGFMCGTGSLLIRIKNNCLPIIMQKIISHPSFKEFLKDKSVGVTMDNLNAGTISNLKIFLPPIELQNQFAEFVEQVEKQKAVMQQSLEKMEMNYKALMQEYF